MPYTPQTPDYSYIALAGQQLGQGVQNVMTRLEDVKKLNLNYESIERARQERIKEAAQEYLEASGETGPEAERKALAYASSRYLPPTEDEKKNPLLYAERADRMDEKHYKEMANLKTKQYFNKTGEQAVNLEEGRLSGQVTTRTPQMTPTPGREADRERLSAAPQSIEELQNRQLAEPPIEKEITVPAAPATERQSTAARIFGAQAIPENIRTDISQAGASELAGQYPAGTTREVVAGEALQKPVSPEAAKTYVESFPTTQQVAEAARKKSAADDLNTYRQAMIEVRRLANQLKSREMSDDETLEAMKALSTYQARQDSIENDIQNQKLKIEQASTGYPRLAPEASEALKQELNDLIEKRNANTFLIDNFNKIIKEEGKKSGKITSAPAPATPSLGDYEKWKTRVKGQ